jgi:hypothetical protein
LKLAIVLLLFAALMSPAVGSDRSDLVERLMEAQGLVATFEQQMAMGKEHCRKLAEQATAQVLDGLDPPPELYVKLKEAADSFIAEVESPWTAREIVDKWAALYGSKFTDDELIQLIAFYQTPLAQREVIAAREAMSRLSLDLQSAYQPIMDSATASYVARLKNIVEECNCRK